MEIKDSIKVKQYTGERITGIEDKVELDSSLKTINYQNNILTNIKTYKL